MRKRWKYGRGDILECWRHENGKQTINYFIVQKRKLFLPYKPYLATDVDYYLAPVTNHHDGSYDIEPWDAYFIDSPPFRLTDSPCMYYGWRKVGSIYNASSI